MTKKKNNIIEPYLISKSCPYCGHDVVLTTNDEIYGKTYGDGKVYLCRNCRASVGCHPGTTIPLGRMANRELKRLKKLAHSYFDQTWKTKKRYRNECYQALANKMGIPIKECHFGWFDGPQLHQAINILKQGLFSNTENIKAEYIDYTSKSIQCITDKFGNFTQNKIYNIKSNSQYLNGKLTNFVITDDEGDYMSIDWCLKKETKFVLVD